MKLTVELLPSSTWGHNLRSVLSRAEWDKVRYKCYVEADYTCEICGGKGKRHPVECHEKWVFDDKRHVQTLVGVEALCPSCHLVRHIGRAYSVGQGEKALRWLAKVNGITLQEAEKYLSASLAEWQYKNKFVWAVDISWVYDYINLGNGGREA